MTLSIKRKIHKTRKRNRYRGGTEWREWRLFGSSDTRAKNAAPLEAESKVSSTDIGLDLQRSSPVNLNGVDDTESGIDNSKYKPETAIADPLGYCDSKKKAIQDSLKKNKIEAFLPDETNDVSKSRGQGLLNIAKKTEQVDAAIQAVSFMGYIPYIGMVIGPLCSLSKTATLGITKYFKYREIAYLSSECLSFVANISKDLVEMNAFYASSIARQANLVIDKDIYGALQKSLYKFLYFSIDSIDFTMTDLGPQQYSFWHKLLLKIDFDKDNYDKDIQANVYRYSCGECIPPDLRKELIKESQKLNGNPKPLVNFNRVGMKKQQSTSMSNRFARYAGNLGRRALTMEQLYIKEPLGFCSDELVNLCKNDNDTVVRLIEYNMYKLIDTTYKERDNIFSKLFADNSNITKEEFSQYFFEVATTIEQNKIDDLEKNLKDTPKEDTLITQQAQEKELRRREALICFNFLVQLKRIIKELDYKVLQSTKSKSLISPTLYVGSKKYLGNPVTTYNQLMRDLIVMNGYFTSATSRYSLDINKLDDSQKKELFSQINRDLVPIQEALTLIVEGIEEDKASLVQVYEDTTPEDAVVGAETTDHPPSGGKILHRRSKKYKRSKKLKSKRNKVKQNRN